MIVRLRVSQEEIKLFEIGKKHIVKGETMFGYFNIIDALITSVNLVTNEIEFETDKIDF